MRGGGKAKIPFGDKFLPFLAVQQYSESDIFLTFPICCCNSRDASYAEEIIGYHFLHDIVTF